MNTKFNRSVLMSGRDVKLTNSLTLHHPSINEILDLDLFSPDEVYSLYTQTILADPYSNMVMLDDIGLNYLEVMPFDVFVIQWQEAEKKYNENKELFDNLGASPVSIIINSLNFFFTEKHTFALGKYEDVDEWCIYDINNVNCQINREVFEIMHEWVKSINNINYEDRINPADENARRILIEDERDKIKKSKRKNNKNKDKDKIDYIGDLMSSVCFGCNGVITPFNINECKIYWLIESLSVDSKKLNTHHVLDSMYHGIMSSKDVNKKELDWTK